MAEPARPQDGSAPSRPELPPAWPGQAGAAWSRTTTSLVLAMVLVIATTGLVYELAMAAVASYLLGDSIRQFSLIIGTYLSALGLGAWASRFVGGRLAVTFVDVELATALVGGLSAPALMLAFSEGLAFQPVLFGTVVVVGTLVGLELPLLIRLLERQMALKDLLARALGVDYAGALLGSVGFSLVLMPWLGLARSSLACGLLNGVVGLACTFILPTDDAHDAALLRRARWRGAAVVLLLGAAFWGAPRLTAFSEARTFGGPVLASAQSPYQRLVLVRRGNGISLHLNGNLQFASVDEHRYHEALVHPVLGSVPRPRRVLIGGGGDGLALREVLRWPGVEHVTLVDLDPEMTRLGREEPHLAALNGDALRNPRVEVINADAFRWLQGEGPRFDVALLDFPDPSNFSLGKLYSTTFYRAVVARLEPGGALGVQATSPLFARRSYWCVVTTLESLGLTVRPYRTYVPSFGEWGFVLASRGALPAVPALPPGPLRWLDAEALPELFQFAPDMARVASPVNRLENQALVALYADEWARWN